MEALRKIDFSALKEKYALTALYFIKPLFDNTGLHFAELFFGMRIQETRFMQEQELQNDIKTLLPPECTNAEITILRSAELEIETLLDWSIRPYAMGHGGNISIEEVEERTGTIVVTLEGSCGSGCSQALGTFRYGVEMLLKEHLPWVKHVKATNLPEEPDFRARWE